MDIVRLVSPVSERGSWYFSDRQLFVDANFHKRYRHKLMLSTIAAAMLLTSCAQIKLFEPSTVDYRDEAGGVLLSVNSVGRWELVADAMQPKFNLADGDAALAKVLPKTAYIQQQILDAFGFSLGLGLPQRTRESVSTQTASESQASTGVSASQGYTSTTTATTKPGVAPAVPGGIPAGGELPPSKASETGLGLDPLLQYRAAASLYQAIQLMNREVALAVKRNGFVPYMLRMQLVNVPYRRHLPYDVYAQVAFFPEEKTLSFEEADEHTELPYVVPLIVTDDLEQAIKSHSAEVARQIGLAVNFMAQGVGGNLGTNRVKRDRESVFAADTNSLLTVARLNDNGIYIRLGAANEATGGNSLIGRTYDITLLLLVPEAYFKNKNTQQGHAPDNVPQNINTEKYINTEKESGNGPNSQSCPPSTPASVVLSVITHTDLRNASSGKLLEERRNETLAEQINAAFQRTLHISYPEMYAAWSRLPQDTKIDIGKKLIGSIQKSEYRSFYDTAYSILLDPSEKKSGFVKPTPGANCTCPEDEHNTDPKTKKYRLACISGGYLRSLWGYLASITVESSTKSALVELPVLPDIVIPLQTALMRDDGKERLDIILREVSGITPGGIRAKLLLKNDNGKSFEFPAEAVANDPATGLLALQFPSPAMWDLGALDYTQSKLMIEPQVCPFTSACAKVKIAPSFEVRHIEQPAAKPKPGFDLRASTNEIVVDKGAGAIRLVFDNLKDDKVTLTWSGAEVKSAKNSDGVLVSLELDKITLRSAMALTLELQNARPDGKVTFKAAGFKGDKKTGELIREFTIVTSQ